MDLAGRLKRYVGMVPNPISGPTRALHARVVSAVETQHAELNPSEESRACRNERDEQSIVDVLGILRCVVAVTVRND